VRALVLEHLHSNPVGVYGEVLAERGIEFDRVRLHELEPLPDWRDYDLMVVMGGGMSVYEEDAHPWLVTEKRAIREAVGAGMPYFGVCLGSQLLAASLGARVYRGPEPELGVNPVFLCEAAPRDPVFRGFPLDIEVFEWHSDTFDLPEQAVRLARSPRYENQAFRCGRVAYAIQCHLETTLEEAQDWFGAWPSLVDTFERSHGRGSLDAFLEEYAASMPFLRQTARQLFRRWLENASMHGRASKTPSVLVPTRKSEGLLGREAEQERISRLLEAARRGRSGTLLVTGETGIGKTALLEDAAGRAAGMRVLRLEGVQSELELSLAGLEALCRPLLDRLNDLPPLHAEALAGALGIGDGARRGDRFTAYAGALGLLALASESEPLLVCVDDAHLLDEASVEALGFIAGRIEAEGIALLVACGGDVAIEANIAETIELGPARRRLGPAPARAALRGRALTPSRRRAAERRRRESGRAHRDPAQLDARSTPRRGTARRCAANARLCRAGSPRPALLPA
jgi:GMP synthase (glutamine-hydrolysing)